MTMMSLTNVCRVCGAYDVFSSMVFWDTDHTWTFCLSVHLLVYKNTLSTILCTHFQEDF